MSPCVGLQGVKGLDRGCFRQHTKPGQDLCTQVMADQTATLSLPLGFYTKRKILQKINDSKGSEVSVRTVILVYLINTFAARKTKKNLFY